MLGLSTFKLRDAINGPAGRRARIRGVSADHCSAVNQRCAATEHNWKQVCRLFGPAKGEKLDKPHGMRGAASGYGFVAKGSNGD